MAEFAKLSGYNRLKSNLKTLVLGFMGSGVLFVLPDFVRGRCGEKNISVIDPNNQGGNVEDDVVKDSVMSKQQRICNFCVCR